MRKTIFFLILLFLFHPKINPSTNEASLNKLIAKCSAIDGDLERLTCFDNLAKSRGLQGPQTLKPNVTGTGNWEVSVKKNPIDDSKTVTLFLQAKSGKTSFGKTISMIIRCQSNETDLYINWKDYLGNEAQVITRVGNAEAETRYWSLSTNSKAAFFPRKVIPFIRTLLGSDRLVAQVTPYNENPVTAIFDITGLTNAIKPLQETCSWR